MRLLFILHNFHPEPMYGAEKICLQEMRELLAQGHEVGLFYPGNSDPTRESLLGDGLGRLILFRVPYLRTKAQVLLSLWKPHAASNFRSCLRKFRPDAVICHHLVRLSLDLPRVAKSEGIPFVYILHDFYPVCPSYSLLNQRGETCKERPSCTRCLFETRFGKTMPAVLLPFAVFLDRMRRLAANKILTRDVDLFISPSKILLEELERRGFRAGRKKIIPYGSECRGERGKVEFKGPVRFGYIGSAIKKKGIEVLAEAFSGEAPGPLLVRGFKSQYDIERFRSLYPDLKADLQTFNPDKESFFAKIDIVVVPSIWIENQPNVIIESFHYGRPVLGSRMGGIEEMLSRGGGLLFEPNDALDLRKKAIYLAENPKEVERLVASIPRWPSVKEHVDSLMEEVTRLLSEKTVKGIGAGVEG